MDVFVGIVVGLLGFYVFCLVGLRCGILSDSTNSCGSFRVFVFLLALAGIDSI